jgi:hypothetical protein
MRIRLQVVARFISQWQLRISLLPLSQELTIRIHGALNLPTLRIGTCSTNQRTCPVRVSE